MNESKQEMNESKQEEKAIMDWLEEEKQNLKDQAGGDFDKLPSPTFADGRITIVEIDFTKPFQKWKDVEKGKTKAIIPCISAVEGKLQKCNWWLNIKNPIYKEIIHIGVAATDRAKVTLKIVQIGMGENTKYKIVKES